ncbi:MAG: S-adenosylmethionine decarboxylase [Candidatus Pacearchaeota archaeon]
MNRKTFGWELNIDLYDCDPTILRDGKLIKKYVADLCNSLEIKRYGPLVMKHFGQAHLQGYSFMQLIEASSIVGHFCEAYNTIYIDIFSCKKFDVKKIRDFTAHYFKARKCVSRVITRY